MRVADYIAQRLADFGVRHVFMITGGGAMHLNDAVGSHPGLTYICNHHEQASAIGAEGYSRVSGLPGVVVVTSGPGGTNTLTGVIGQWLDSVPALYISGQVKRETTIERCRELGLRQLGDQEINIVDIVRPVTKFAAVVSDPLDVGNLMDQAWAAATTGRPGPVWLDVPLDVQGAEIDPAVLRPSVVPSVSVLPDPVPAVDEVVSLLTEAQRPVILAGQGIRLAGGTELFLQLAERLQIPVVTSFMGFDLIPSDHPLFMGRPGTVGTRAGNFVTQNADLLLCIGTRNNIRQVSYTWQCFGRAAKKVVVDIDAAELTKPTVRPDLAVHADAAEFLRLLAERLPRELLSWECWLEWCRVRRERFPFVLPKHRESSGGVNPYHFIDRLSAFLPEEAVVSAGNGTACVVLFQAGRVKKGQRIFWNSGCASMGYDLPAAIGACFAVPGRDVVCLAGDGSLQMNVQELQTVAHHRLPLKLFVLNNNGYVSIRQTQDSFFSGRRIGCGPEAGVSFPDAARLAAAYSLPSVVIDGHDGIDDALAAVLATPGPVVCDVRLTPDYIFEPKLSSERRPDGTMVSKPLEDMYPFLDRAEFRNNMLID